MDGWMYTEQISCPCFITSPATSTTDIYQMAHPEWTRIFQIKTKNLKDPWRLEFDEDLVPNRPNLCWKSYIRNTSGRFRCTECGRGWSSNRAMVVFHMRLNHREGIVKVRPLRQNCKVCDGAPMEKPDVTSENIGILLENLVQKIRIKCYHENLGKKIRHFRSIDQNNPHEPAHSTSATDTYSMAEVEWTRIFQTKANSLNEGDSWCLEFNDTLVPHSPNPGWQPYIRNTGARFKCTKCGRGWPSNRVKVVFHMRLTGSQGVVKVRRFRQNCKICSAAPMEKPNIPSENIHILMENLRLPPLVGPTLVIFFILPPALCSYVNVNCSEPNQPALLQALTPLFNLSDIRPVIKLQKRTNISTFFTMYGILGVWWMNDFVRWDPIQCGTKKISLPREKFWVPDIVINEFMDENTAPFVPYVYLYSDGRVYDALPAKVISSCNLDIYTFPFDIQNCTLTFNSYLHLAMDVMIFLGKPAENITEESKEVMTTMGEWELLDITVHKYEPGIDYDQYIDELTFHIRVKRRATLYVVNLLIPSCFLITVDLFSFLLPPQSVDRSSFKMTLILGYTVFLLIMNDLLPITGNTIPLITPCSAIMQNCSEPNPPSLLDALTPVFSLKDIRPVMDISTPTNVSINFILYGILGVKWRSEFVSWDPEKCGSSWVTIPRKRLWVPDVVINEFMDKNTAPFVPYSYVFSDGLIHDEQPIRVISSCRLDIYLFPFDIQNCSLSFNSYLHRMDALQISQYLPVEKVFEYSKKVMATKGEWELVGITVTTLQFPAGDGEDYQEIRYFILVRRQPTLYVVNLLIPSCFLITVDLFSFMLPPKSVDRSLFKMTLILGYTVFLLIMNDLLPITGDTIPLINVFLSLCLAMMVASLLETTIITNLLCGSGHYSSVPQWIRVFVLHFLGRLVCLPPKPKDTVIQNPAAQEQSEAPEQIGPLDDNKALQELRSLGRNLQAIRLQVEQKLGVNQISEEWIQNEKTQILTTFLWLRLYWHHEFLVWDPDECDGISRISLPVKQLWSPDIIVYEFVDDDVSQACPYVYVNHTGHIRWDRMLRLVSACNLEIFSFPFDVQNCTFTFGSYMHTIRDVRVSPALTFKEMSENSKRYLEASGEWELVDILGETSILQFGIDEWDIITFWVVIKRRPVLYVVNLLIPSSFLMLIDILSFYLPPHSVDRASFKMTLILGYTVFLLIMNDLLPSTANGTPIIGIYFSVCLALMVISLLETVIITNVLHHSTMKYREVPKWVRVVVLKHIANLICYRGQEEVQPPSVPQKDKPDSQNCSSDLQIVQTANQTPAQHPTNSNGGSHVAMDSACTAAPPELQQICQYLGHLRDHLTSLEKESELQGQWCHVGYVLDFLLFRIYLLLISCYALVIICMCATSKSSCDVAQRLLDALAVPHNAIKRQGEGGKYP
ncbi:hypothetical protein L3Q82_007963 [Scortum barcoo]|uniref:Uncharacterized protein n=1 Tax=Scortum barcoo TaxID=214431 RepID=A0ACB8WLT0_9TELE|nr:hypothetical protein L3Q82_007963 [Scortum barcoo]